MKIKFLFIIALILVGSSAYCQVKSEAFQKASDAFDRGDYQKSIELIDNALKTDSLNLDYLMLKGFSHEKAAQYQEAYDSYSLGIQAHPAHAWPYNQRGLLLKSLKETELSIKDFDAALAFEKSDSLRLGLLLNRGAAKIDIRDFHGAYNDFEAALKIDSLDVGLLNNIAAVSDEVGKGDQTLGYLYKIIRIDSTFLGGYGNIGFKHQQMGDHQEAIKYFNIVLEKDPDDALSYSNRAYSLYKLGKTKEALADINRSIKLYPGNSYAYRTRALIYLFMEDNKKACEDIAESLKQGFTKMYGGEVETLQSRFCN